MSRSPGRRGFTLIELLVTLAVLGVLATVTVPMAQLVAQRHKEHELRIALRSIREAIDAYKRAADEGRIRRLVGQTGYPPTLDALVDGEVDVRDPKGRRLYFLRQLPRDPLVADPAIAPAQTWRVRSYASEPTDPRPGDDVYDVRSGAGGTGLNGIAYRHW